jgi:hypothetical protein
LPDSQKKTLLENIALVASIASSLAIPVVIGLAGWSVQRTIADQGLRKDYTDMAIRVLENADATKQADLRMWAADLLDRNAPLPLNKKARDQLLGSFLPITHQFELTVPEKLMEAPRPWIMPPVKGFKSDAELDKNYVDNHLLSGENAIKLEFLQKLIRNYQDSQHKLESELDEIERQGREERDKILNK